MRSPFYAQWYGTFAPTVCEALYTTLLRGTSLQVQKTDLIILAGRPVHYTATFESRKTQLLETAHLNRQSCTLPCHGERACRVYNIIGSTIGHTWIHLTREQLHATHSNIGRGSL